MLNFPLNRVLLLAGVLLLAANSAWSQVTNPVFANSTDKLPTAWTGPVFQLSHAYPATAPVTPAPWKSHDFRTHPKQYIQSVINYCFEGNTAVDFEVDKNTERNWYHAPGMAKGDSGREFIHGLTKERGITLADLDATAPATSVQSWAVGFYNPVGGVTLGKVWASPGSPDPSQAIFADGTVSFKLLFTTATAAELPFLTGAPEWQANINRNLDHVTTAAPTVRLLQVDVAVRDSRADSTTGWVFGTFEYRYNSRIHDPWKRLVPVGLMWGNDPTLLTQAEVDAAGGLKETWLNKPALAMPHYGYLNRLNGPVDNPGSSCLSCHSTAAFPLGNLIPKTGSPAEIQKFFQNIAAGQTSGNGAALDYSLQLADGFRNFPGTLLSHGSHALFNLPSATASTGDDVLRDGSMDLDAEADRIIKFRAMHPSSTQPVH